MTCLIFYALCFYHVVTIDSMEVTTTLERIRGKLVDDDITDAYYYSFEGIRFAEPPLKDLRFKPSVPKRAWTNVLDATKPGCVCPQPELYYTKKEMSEYCLFFSIYTPANFLNKKFPVMVYIHTGNFKLLSGNPEPVHGPQLQILGDIVTMNYRLGALGFLSMCTEEVSGNAGIKDVLLVLKLVKNNVGNFGGDANKITVAGNGAGASIIEYLMLTNQSAGLFQRAVIHSASVLSERFIQLHPREYAISLGKELGFKWIHEHSLLEKLRRANAFDIVKAQETIALRDPQRGLRLLSQFKPTVEINCPSAIITRPPYELLKEGIINNVPMLIRFNIQEGLEIFPELRKNPKLIDRFNENNELYIPSDIEYPHGSTERRKLALRIKDYYFGGENLSCVNIQHFINLITDGQYSYSMDHFIKMFKERRTASVFYYTFDGDEQLNWFKISENITYPGAAHDDDIGYVFLTSVTKLRYKSADPPTKEFLLSFLYNLKHFMLFGSPAPNADTNCWPEAGKNRYYLKHTCRNIAVFHRPIPERIGFWYSLYDEYYRRRGYSGSCFCTNVHSRN